MRYYSIAYVAPDGSACEFRRFSSRNAAENCAEMLNQAYCCLGGDQSWTRYAVLESMEFERWPSDSTGILEIDRDLTFDRTVTN